MSEQYQVRITTTDGRWIGGVSGIDLLIEDYNTGAVCWHLHGGGKYVAGFSADGLCHDFPSPERIGFPAQLEDSTPLPRVAEPALKGGE